RSGGGERLPHLEQDEEHLRLFGRLLAARLAADVAEGEAAGKGARDVEAEALGDLVDVLDDLRRGAGNLGGLARVGAGARRLGSGRLPFLDIVDLRVAHPDDVA